MACNYRGERERSQIKSRDVRESSGIGRNAWRRVMGARRQDALRRHEMGRTPHEARQFTTASAAYSCVQLYAPTRYTSSYESTCAAHRDVRPYVSHHASFRLKETSETGVTSYFMRDWVLVWLMDLNLMALFARSLLQLQAGNQPIYTVSHRHWQAGSLCLSASTVQQANIMNACFLVFPHVMRVGKCVRGCLMCI